jgi:hypothetical protein
MSGTIADVVTRECRKSGFRAVSKKLTATIRLAARAKQTNDVTELAIQNNQNVMARTTP